MDSIDKYDTSVFNSPSDSSNGKKSYGAGGDGSGKENELESGPQSPKGQLATTRSLIWK